MAQDNSCHMEERNRKPALCYPAAQLAVMPMGKELLE